MRNLIAGMMMVLTAGVASAAGGGAELEYAATDVNNRASLQRGAKYFVNYCMGCHSAKYMRYNRLMKDLGLTERQTEENFLFTGGKVTQMMTIAMRPDDGARWFGATPPDLSLTARSRGADWIFTYLKSFYPDSSRPVGWNNVVFPDASMPNVLWDLQGVREPVFETRTDDMGVEQKVVVGWEYAAEGAQSEEEFEGTARDITAFLEYASEPARLQRESLGWKVLLYLALFTFLAYLLKVEFWRDVH